MARNSKKLEDIGIMQSIELPSPKNQKIIRRKKKKDKKIVRNLKMLK